MNPAESWAATPAVRRSMQSNRSRDTTPEIKLRKLLWARGLRYRVIARPLPDFRRKVDIVLRPSRVAVELLGCFWHGCPEHFRLPAANREYWVAKIARNQARDAETAQVLRDAGWVLVTAWEHEDLAAVADTVADLVRDRRPAPRRKAPPPPAIDPGFSDDQTTTRW